MKLPKINKNSGFVILFAVTVSAILLAIAIGVANVALKEIKFGTSAKDTNEAFFAADAGAECALYNDKASVNLFVDPNSPVIICAGVRIGANEDETNLWSFVIPGLGENNRGCAIVTVDKRSLVMPQTTIISKGYNVGDENCASVDPNRVERQIEVSY
ncbi:hypothetical protein IT399_01220 [Candidatus Nomurabacteria bacterium]|nr:hypothetical protein [Candidatus Nomurabacteria bacterium]